MNKDKIIEARNRTYDIYRRFARNINDIDSNVIKVEIHYEMRFLTGVCPTKPLIDDDILNPDDKLFWYHKCLNPDCTGSGFYLTDEISEAINLIMLLRARSIAMEKKTGSIWMPQDVLARQHYVTRLDQYSSKLIAFLL